MLGRMDSKSASSAFKDVDKEMTRQKILWLEAEAADYCNDIGPLTYALHEKLNERARANREDVSEDMPQVVIALSIAAMAPRRFDEAELQRAGLGLNVSARDVIIRSFELIKELDEIDDFDSSTRKLLENLQKFQHNLDKGNVSWHHTMSELIYNQMQSTLMLKHEDVPHPIEDRLQSTCAEHESIDFLHTNFGMDAMPMVTISFAYRTKGGGKCKIIKRCKNCAAYKEKMGFTPNDVSIALKRSNSNYIPSRPAVLSSWNWAEKRPYFTRSEFTILHERSNSVSPAPTRRDSSHESSTAHQSRLNLQM